MNDKIKVKDKSDGEVGYAMRQEFDTAERYVWVSVGEASHYPGQYILRQNLVKG